jgi:hypothetical protein
VLICPHAEEHNKVFLAPLEGIHAGDHHTLSGTAETLSESRLLLVEGRQVPPPAEDPRHMEEVRHVIEYH